KTNITNLVPLPPAPPPGGERGVAGGRFFGDSRKRLQVIEFIEVDPARADRAFRLIGPMAIAAGSHRHAEGLGPLSKDARTRHFRRWPVDFNRTHAEIIQFRNRVPGATLIRMRPRRDAARVRYELDCLGDGN